jgi:hypothetical protein
MTEPGIVDEEDEDEEDEEEQVRGPSENFRPSDFTL